jgi:hypothetical protein
VVNETIQWAILLLFAVLILGLFRQIALMLPANRRSADDGPRQGQRLPNGLLDQLATVLPQFKASHGVTVAFISEGCVGCQRLLAALSDRPADLDGQVVLVVQQPSLAFKAALSELDVPMVFDDTGSLWEACSINATPLVAYVESNGKVVRKEVTHDVRRVALAPS